MDQAITVGALVWFFGLAVVIIGLVGVFVLILSILANQFKH